MRAYFKKLLFLTFCLVFTTSNFVSCSSANFSFDAYSIAKPSCENGDIYEPSKECKEALLKLFPFDESYDRLDPHGYEKDRVLRALYALGFSINLDFPQDRVIFGTTAIRDIFPQTMLQLKTDHPDMTWNQILFNFLKASSSTFRLQENPGWGAYYNNDHSISLPVRFYQQPSTWVKQSLQLRDMSLLMHEAMHSQTLGHEISCQDISPGLPECDRGTEKPHGWEVAIHYGIMRGATFSKLQTDLRVIPAYELCREFRYIFNLPETAQPLKSLDCTDNYILYREIAAVLTGGDVSIPLEQK